MEPYRSYAPYRDQNRVETGLVMIVIAFVTAVGVTFVGVKTKGLLNSVGDSIPHTAAPAPGVVFEGLPADTLLMHPDPTTYRGPSPAPREHIGPASRSGREALPVELFLHDPTLTSTMLAEGKPSVR